MGEEKEKELEPVEVPDDELEIEVPADPEIEGTEGLEA
jgi:hypothetical protein